MLGLVVNGQYPVLQSDKERCKIVSKTRMLFHLPNTTMKEEGNDRRILVISMVSHFS